MMTIDTIYKKYDILPALQIHMKRTAGVAKIIAESISAPVDTDNIVRAMLLHDMGNIIKFNLDLLPELLTPKGKPYWEHVQKQFISTYGRDEHDATMSIAKEIGLSERVIALLEAVGFSKSNEVVATRDISKKICCYADQRVTPYGVVSLEVRLDEGRKRFIKNKGLSNDEGFELNRRNLIEIEKQIFVHSSIFPQDISDETVSRIVQSTYLDTLEIS